MNNPKVPGPDPLDLIDRVRTWCHSRWLEKTYPFALFGNHVSIHHSCDIRRSVSPFILLDDRVYLAPDVWLNVTSGSASSEPKITIGKGCGIGRRSTISARNLIALESNVLLAPSVLLMDHNHEFSDVGRPILEQGVTEGGRIIIEKNCWLGCSVVVVCGRGELRIGQNSVIGANSVVTQSVPAFSVVGGNPAKFIKRFDAERQQWVRA
jgi:abequosyltransferase